MNIAVLCYHRLGGSGILAHEMGLALADTGRHHVHFIGVEPPFRYLDDYHANIHFHKVEVKDYPVFMFFPYTLSLASQLADIVDECGIDVIHSHYAIPHAVAAYLARDIAKRTPRTVTTLHGTDITLIGSHPTFKNITRHAINTSDAVTAVSDYLIRKTESVLDIPPGKIHRIYNFVSARLFNTEQRCSCMKNLCKHSRVITHASNLRAVKAPLDVVRIFHRLVEDGQNDVELWIIGDGPLRGEMAAEAETLGIKDRVQFLGIQTNLGRILVCSDIFLLPSREESFGLAALEAMACGVPVVASNRGGLPEVIEDGVSGFLIEQGDIEAGARSAARILTDEQLHQRMSAAAVKTATETFRADDIIAQYEAVYHAG